jgi:hypothetical protein
MATKAPKNSGSQGFTHTSTPSGSSMKHPTMPMSTGGTPSKPAQPACTEMSSVAGGLPAGGAMMEDM